jgi:hypothetical protein
MPGVAFRLRDAVPRVLKQCGDYLTRANVMRQVANLLLPGIKINTSPTRFGPINQEQMVRFNGTTWEPLRRHSFRQLIPRPPEPHLAWGQRLNGGGATSANARAHQRSEGVDPSLGAEAKVRTAVWRADETATSQLLVNLFTLKSLRKKLVE